MARTDFLQTFHGFHPVLPLLFALLQRFKGG